MRRRILIGVGVILAAAIGVGIYLYTTLNDQTEAKASDAVTEFRKEANPEQPARDGLPKQGVYSYTVTGREKISRGLTIKRTLPSNCVALLRHRADGYEMETRFSEQHTEIARYDLKPEGTYLTFAVTTVEAGPIKTTKERAWMPKLLRFPATARAVPKTWGGDYTAGDLKLNVKARLLPAQKVTVGGTSVDVKVAEFVQSITGEYTGTRTETFWYSPKTGVTVRYKVDSSLKGPTDFDFSADQTLTSLDPEA